MLKKDFDSYIIFKEIQKDSLKKRKEAFLGILFFSLAIIVALPIALYIFFSLFAKSYTLLHLNFEHLVFAYLFILIYYFIVLYYSYDTSNYVKNSSDYKKAILSFLIASFLALISLRIDNRNIYILFAIFFIATIYFLSKSYYNFPAKYIYGMSDDLYRTNDLGLYGGYLNDPFSIKDDINRTKLAIQSSTLGFDFIVLFINMILKYVIFLYAIRYKRYLHESARLFYYILKSKRGENRLNLNYFSFPSKIILEVNNYLSFSDDKIVFFDRANEVAKKSLK